jgi:hypothetical protein
MLCAAQEEMLESPTVWRGEEMCFLAMLSAVEPETHIDASKVKDKKPHQGSRIKIPHCIRGRRSVTPELH